MQCRVSRYRGYKLAAHVKHVGGALDLLGGGAGGGGEEGVAEPEVPTLLGQHGRADGVKFSDELKGALDLKQD